VFHYCTFLPSESIHVQGLKKCKFPWKLVEISRGPQVEDNRCFMMS